MSLIVELLDSSVHTREGFYNSEPAIEVFLKTRAKQEHEHHISDTYVLVDDADKRIIFGFFTLSYHSIKLNDLPQDLIKKLPKYPTIGTVLLGRMGRDHRITPMGFGTIILKEALKKSLERGSFFALELHAKNEKLIKYYKNFGFTALNDDNHHMILPYSIIKRLVNIQQFPA